MGSDVPQNGRLVNWPGLLSQPFPRVCDAQHMAATIARAGLLLDQAGTLEPIDKP
jgi:hypothetical protein